MGLIMLIAVVWGLIVMGPLGWAILAVVLLGMMAE